MIYVLKTNRSGIETEWNPIVFLSSHSLGMKYLYYDVWIAFAISLMVQIVNQTFLYHFQRFNTQIRTSPRPSNIHNLHKKSFIISKYRSRFFIKTKLFFNQITVRNNIQMWTKDWTLCYLNLQWCVGLGHRYNDKIPWDDPTNFGFVL